MTSSSSPAESVYRYPLAGRWSGSTNQLRNYEVAISTMNKNAKELPTFVYEFKMTNDERILQIHQDPEGNWHCGIGATIWDCSLCASKYFQNTNIFVKDFWVDKKVLELGSGIGLIGITLAALGANVVMSDLELVMPLLTKNILSNLKFLQHNNVPETMVIDWNSDDMVNNVLEQHSSFDFIIASDCIVWPELVRPLFDVIYRIATEDTQVFIGYECRNSDADRELTAIIQSNRWKTIEIEQSDMDPVFSCDDIHIFLLTKRKSLLRS